MTSEAAVPRALRELWRQRAQLLASNVATQGREHREIAHAAALIQQDYHNRFLVELLQNANDQALLGGGRESTVVVVRSERLLAVSNGGQAVTQRNLERFSSLADSDKPGVLLGNKGVGFKAVYQVTDVPEIYSADDRTSGNVCADFAIGFALQQDPFKEGAFVTAIEDDIRAFFAENAGLAGAIAARGFTDPVDAVRPEFTSVAGFRFPLARGRQDLADRLAQLRIPAEEQKVMRTVVVLPLRDQSASDDVEAAIDRFVGTSVEPGQAELAVLFLTGVGVVTVLDQVRDLRWTFTRQPEPADGPVARATVSACGPDRTKRVTSFWLLRRDALECPPPIAAERRRVIESALEDFGLEAWSVDDPLPVTVALPAPGSGPPAPLGPPGRFCLGLPTTQSTGLPVHVDARFFATISRTGLDFALSYNALLLDVATDLFGELLGHLRRSVKLEDRRAATLALQRTAGALADRVFASGGLADGDVVLAWGGERFLPRRDCRLPDPRERSLLPFLRDAVNDQPDLLREQPEEGLLADAAGVLESIGLPALRSSPHAWLKRHDGAKSAIECAARRHRADGPDYWEPFVSELLGCFDTSALQDQSWLPVGGAELAAPSQRVFLPVPVDTHGDEEEVPNVPIRVAEMIRLVDGGALRLREDGRALTKLALRLEEAGVRRPRKNELLEEALFPALEKAAETDDELALELFGQAVSWVASMREASRKKLDCSQALVPISTDRGRSWELASRSYVGEGWGLPSEQDRLLAQAYPRRRLLSFSALRGKLGVSIDDAAKYREAVEAMGVTAVPRVISLESRAPLESYNYRLVVVGHPSLGRADLDPIYREYVQFLATSSTTWSYSFAHDVDDTSWVDGLELPERRQHVLDLILMNPEAFLPRASVSLCRVGHSTIRRVESMWVFALARLGWSVFPGERGVGREPLRVPSERLWRLPEGARRTGYAQLINVVPYSFSSASRLLNVLGVPSVEDAPLERLLNELSLLAQRLDAELLHTRREALSLAIELYERIDQKLQSQPLERMPTGSVLPLLRDRRLEAVTPSDESVLVMFDDEPARARHVTGIDRAFRVPVARDETVARTFELFARSWPGRVLRTSDAQVDLEFTASPGGGERLVDWLEREFPHTEVAAELAALLTLGSERSVRAERLSRNWRAFEKLVIVFGSFRDPGIRSFYDRVSDNLWVTLSLTKCDIVASTWELAGARSRDLWAGYARALEAGNTRSFLREHEIGDVEIVDVADAAGLHRSMSVERLAPALQAARCHALPGTTLDEAATWFSSIGDRVEDVATAFGRPELAAVLTEALGLPSPEGEIHMVRHLGVPWGLWQDALLRRDGARYVFAESVQRYREVRDHLIAVAREVGVRETRVDLSMLAGALAAAVSGPVPDAVQLVPPNVADADGTAWRDMLAMLLSHEPVAQALSELPAPPWGRELPIPKDATRRGVRLFHESNASTREIEATTSVKAVVEAAMRLASSLGEQLDPAAVLGNAGLITRMQGEWASVYAALLFLRPLIEATAPEVTKKLSSVQAFRDPSTLNALMAKLPELPRPELETQQPKQSVLGVELTAGAVRADLLSGSHGVLGAKLVAAAQHGIDPDVLIGQRAPLPPPTGRGSGGGGGTRGGSKGHSRTESTLVGDIGEAFVHEWLVHVLGTDYGPDCWVSGSRERYGLPPCGNDDLGYDFKVPDPGGRLFGQPATAFLIEVKSTVTDGSGPFPMSQPEWDQARQCHEAGVGPVYVILRVVEADTRPRISDCVIDPFAAYRRGEVRLTERDLWVIVSPRR